MPIETAISPAEAIEVIVDAYKRRDLVIDDNSRLAFLLNEARKLLQATQDLAPGANDSETDSNAVAVAGRLLEVVRLGMALKLHSEHATPKITETLATLVAFRNGKDEHEPQFHESEYELHAASQFVCCGARVAFVDTSKPSRYNQRVEFMLGTKWPVECKRPRAPHTVIENVHRAVEKLNERKQPGIVCVAIDSALPHRNPFREVFKIDDLIAEVSKEFITWCEKYGDKLRDAIDGSFARFVILSYTTLVYEHGSEQVMLPSLRLGFSVKDWLTQDVCCECIRRLESERST